MYKKSLICIFSAMYMHYNLALGLTVIESNRSKYDMNKVKLYQKISLLLIVTFLSGFANAAERTQVIPLKKGWNAVYLEVDPVVENQDLSAFILGTQDPASVPIEVIATYFDKIDQIQFNSSVDEINWNQASWRKWVHDQQPDAFLSNLYDLQAGRSYLVKASADYDWSITGDVRRIYKTWHPNTYNLTGFQVGAMAPSFHTLFEGSKTASGLASTVIYTLKDNQWEKVSLPDTAVDKGKAYWVYNNGESDFQGKLSVYMESDPKGTTGLDFLDHLPTQTITLENTSDGALTASLSLVDNQVPLSLVTSDDLEDLVYTPVTADITSISVPAGDTVDVVLSVRRDEITDKTEKTGLLKVTVSESYEEFWLPISAYGDL